MSILISLGGEVSEGKVEDAAKRGTVDKVDLEEQWWRESLLLRPENGWGHFLFS